MYHDWDVGAERTIKGIERKANKVWASVRRMPKYCHNIVASMPKHINEIISRSGSRFEFVLSW